MQLECQLVHRVPGRLRFRVDAARGDAPRLAGIAQAVAALPGVTSAVANPVTGSVVVYHQSDFSSLLDGIPATGLRFARSGPGCAPVAQGPRPQAVALGNLSRFAPQHVLFFLVLVTLAIYQASEGYVLAPAVTLLWYAFHVLRMNDPASTLAAV